MAKSFTRGRECVVCVAVIIVVSGCRIFVGFTTGYRLVTQKLQNLFSLLALLVRWLSRPIFQFQRFSRRGLMPAFIRQSKICWSSEITRRLCITAITPVWELSMCLVQSNFFVLLSFLLQQKDDPRPCSLIQQWRTSASLIVESQRARGVISSRAPIGRKRMMICGSILVLLAR